MVIFSFLFYLFNLNSKFKILVIWSEKEYDLKNSRNQNYMFQESVKNIKSKVISELDVAKNIYLLKNFIRFAKINAEFFKISRGFLKIC